MGTGFRNYICEKFKETGPMKYAPPDLHMSSALTIVEKSSWIIGSILNTFSSASLEFVNYFSLSEFKLIFGNVVNKLLEFFVKVFIRMFTMS